MGNVIRAFKPPAAPDVELSSLSAYRSIWALAVMDKRKKNSLLKATHYAACLIQGNNPMWGVWTVNGKFLRFYGSRKDIEAAYPDLMWRRKMTEWSFSRIADYPVETRRAVLEERYGK